MSKTLDSGLPREVISMADCKKIAEKDLGTNNGKDFESDVIQLYLMLNTLALIGDEDWRTILRAGLSQFGFVRFQKKLDVCYHTYVTGGYQTGEVDGTTDLDVYFTNQFCGPLSQKGLGVVCEYIAQLTQFGKRFTYQTVVNPTAPYEAFLKNNFECYSPERALSDVPLRYKSNHIWKDTPEYKVGKPFSSNVCRRPSNYLMGKLKQRFTEMLPNPFELLDELTGPEVLPSYFALKLFSTLSRGWDAPSNGSAFCESVGRTTRLKADKIRSIMNAYPFFPVFPEDRETFSDYQVAAPINLYQGHYAGLYHGSLYNPVMIDVPKSLTSRRLICIEDVCMSYYSKYVRELIELSLEMSDTLPYVAAEDQETNRWLALVGSATGEFATIDETAASDRQSRWLMLEALPDWLKPLVINGISDYITVNGETVVVDCFSTMGNQMTWLLLGVFTKAVGDIACGYYDEDQQYQSYSKGDDLIVPSIAYDTACDLLEIFGSKVNRDKSYGTGLFRESCGGNYVAGYDVTPVYWRRGPVDYRDYPDFIQYLCTMQHSFYGVPQVRFWFEDAVRKFDPEITYSPVGWECDDLWSGLVTAKEALMSPHKKRTASRPNAQSVKAVTKIKDVYPQWYQYAQYMSFLMNGPRYLTEADERWGISSSRLDPADFVEPTSRWRKASPSYSK